MNGYDLKHKMEILHEDKMCLDLENKCLIKTLCTYFLNALHKY